MENWTVGVTDGRDHGVRPSVTARATRLLVAVLLAAVNSGVTEGLAAPARQVALDPRRVALVLTDLPLGFTPVPERTGYEERPDGVAVYEATFARPPTPENLAEGTLEVRNGVARVASVDEAATQLAGSREAFVSAGWTESPVEPLGEQALGLSREEDGPSGRSSAHLYLFRQGTWVILVGVAGRSDVTRLGDTVRYAIVVSDRLHAVSGSGAPPAASPAPLPPPPTDERVRVGIVGGGSANVRAQPSTAAPILDSLPDGTVLDLAGPNRAVDGRTWRNVRLSDGRTGWIAGELLVSVPPAGPPPQEATMPAGPGDTQPSAAGPWTPVWRDPSARKP